METQDNSSMKLIDSYKIEMLSLWGKPLMFDRHASGISMLSQFRLPLNLLRGSVAKIAVTASRDVLPTIINPNLL
jgi:hypothetical protein